MLSPEVSVMRMSLEAELPLGLALAMAQRPEAVERFAALGEPERQALIARARSARSKQAMQSCLEALM